jgi:hypothetical protein
MKRLSGLVLGLMLLVCGVVRGQATNAVDGILSGLLEQPMNPVLLRELKAAIPGSTDTVQRCRLGVLLTLGTLASGNTEEGLLLRARARKAFPGNDLLQDLADARLSRPCTDCENGLVLDPCAACNGSGRCPICKGTGQQDVPGMGTDPRQVKCMHCADNPGKCKTCAGTKGLRKACPACSGTGLILAAGKANVLYMRMLKALAPPDVKGPVVIVVTAAPPAAVQEDPAVARAAQVARAVESARTQAAATPLLQKYPITADDMRGIANPDLTAAQREEAVAALMKKGMAHPTRGRFFFMPVPAGLSYCVADVVKNPYGGYFLKLTSTPPAKKKGPPVSLTSRDVLDETARTLCEPLGSFLSDPTVCVPDGDLKTGSLRKGEVIESGSWLIPVQLSQWGSIQKVGTCYRSADELLAQMGFSR